MSSSILEKRTAIFCLWTMWAAGCGADWLTVAEAQQQAIPLAGQRVRVRGYLNSDVVSHTLQSCGSTNPCCNSASMHTYLMPTPELDISGSYWESKYIRIYAQGLYSPICGGSECSLTCSPFNPRASAAYEFSGVLHTFCASTAKPPEPNQGCQPPIVSLALTDLDMSASSQLSGDAELANLNREPIPTGTFTIP